MHLLLGGTLYDSVLRAYKKKSEGGMPRNGPPRVREKNPSAVQRRNLSRGGGKGDLWPKTTSSETRLISIY